MPSVVSMATGPGGFFFRRCPVEDQVTTQPTVPTYGQKEKLLQADPSDTDDQGAPRLLPLSK